MSDNNTSTSVDTNNQRMHLDRIGRQLSISQMEDWYRVSAEVSVF